MRALLDTHTFLWFILDDAQLSSTARELIADPSNEIQISPATYWEVAIKISLGKYTLPEAYESFMETHLAANELEILHILPKHTALLTTMPLHHKDPFDRLLIAQALAENIAIISVDSQLDAYGVKRLW
jgi:PIN domain nuclease of toxin-antitoxin system